MGTFVIFLGVITEWVSLCPYKCLQIRTQSNWLQNPGFSRYVPLRRLNVIAQVRNEAQFGNAIVVTIHTRV